MSSHRNKEKSQGVLPHVGYSVVFLEACQGGLAKADHRVKIKEKQRQQYHSLMQRHENNICGGKIDSLTHLLRSPSGSFKPYEIQLSFNKQSRSIIQDELIDEYKFSKMHRRRLIAALEEPVLVKYFYCFHLICYHIKGLTIIKILENRVFAALLLMVLQDN